MQNAFVVCFCALLVKQSAAFLTSLPWVPRQLVRTYLGTGQSAKRRPPETYLLHVPLTASVWGECPAPGEMHVRRRAKMTRTTRLVEASSSSDRRLYKRWGTECAENTGDLSGMASDWMGSKRGGIRACLEPPSSFLRSMGASSRDW